MTDKEREGLAPQPMSSQEQGRDSNTPIDARAKTEQTGFVLTPPPDWYTAKFAADELEHLGSTSLVLECVREGNTELLKHASVRALLVRLLEGKRPLGRGQKKPQTIRNSKITWTVAKFVARGLAQYSDNENRTPTACDLAGKEYNLSPETVKDIWRDRALYLYRGPRIKTAWQHLQQLEVISSAKAFLVYGELVRDNPHKDWGPHHGVVTPDHAYVLTGKATNLLNHGDQSLDQKAREFLLKKIGPAPGCW